ncbi:MAG: HNH endonuclease [Prolixibacteraceae bacterium]|nr:HNH endonuclease [Prolixibacteraceae bacterium]
MLRKLFKLNKKTSKVGDALNTSTENRKSKPNLTNDEIDFFVNKEIKKRLSEIELLNFGNDELFDEAAKFVTSTNQASTSIVQRKFSIGYNRAVRIVEQLENAGIIGTSNGLSPRKVLFSEEALIEIVKKEKVFIEEFLTSMTDYIQSKVDEFIQQKEIENKNYIKESLKFQILEEDNARQDKLKKKQIKEQLRKEMIEQGIITDISEGEKKREPIPQEIQDRVWNRDSGRCVKCGCREKLEFDHIIPFSKGGSNTYRNLQILCEKCNRQKNNKIG